MILVCVNLLVDTRVGLECVRGVDIVLLDAKLRFPGENSKKTTKSLFVSFLALFFLFFLFSSAYPLL